MASVVCLVSRDYLPVLFDFEKPTSQTTDETITLPAKHAAGGLGLRALAPHSNIGIERGPFPRHW
jgi:hypothetical protein